eukprot:955038-Prymnesium_polylepis.4
MNCSDSEPGTNTVDERRQETRVKARRIVEREERSEVRIREPNPNYRARAAIAHICQPPAGRGGEIRRRQSSVGALTAAAARCAAELCDRTGERRRLPRREGSLHCKCGRRADCGW